MGLSKNAFNESCENQEEGGGVRGRGGEARKAEDLLESKVGSL